MRFQPHLRLHFENSFFYVLRSKVGVSSDHAGMKKLSVKVSILCLWTDNLHLVTCSKREFLNLCHCSRSALEKLCEIYTYDRRPHGWPDQKSILACADAKKENRRITKLFLKHVSSTLLMSETVNKRELFSDGKSRGPRSVRATLTT